MPYDSNKDPFAENSGSTGFPASDVVPIIPSDDTDFPVYTATLRAFVPAGTGDATVVILPAHNADGVTRTLRYPEGLHIEHIHTRRVLATGLTPDVSLHRYVTMPVPSYDFLIESDGDVNTPGSWLHFWEHHTDEEISGKRIGIAADVTIDGRSLTTRRPAELTVLCSADPENPATLNNLNYNGSWNWRLEDLRLTSNTWSTAVSACILHNGEARNLNTLRCKWIGNYRGVVGASFDPTVDVPEYACIAAEVSAGAISSLDITRSFVGDLLEPGTYDLDFSPAGGSGATATFTVTNEPTATPPGNHITSTNLTNGGSGYNTNQHRTRRAVWTGQQRMLDYLPWGLRRGASGFLTGFESEDDEFYLLANAIKPSPAPLPGSDRIRIAKAHMDLIYMDFVSLGLSGDAAGMPVELEFCFFTRPFARNGDAGDAHCDFLQCFQNDVSPPLTSVNWKGVRATGCIFFAGETRGTAQGFFLAESPNGVFYEYAICEGCLIVADGMINAIYLEHGLDAFCRWNTAVKYSPSNPVNVAAYKAYFTSVSSGALHANVLELIEAPAAVDTASQPNTIVGTNGGTIPYGDVFTNPTGPRSTWDEIIAAYTTIGAHSSRGAFAAPHINHATRTIDRALEPSWISWPDITEAELDALTASEWRRVMGGPAGRAISITGGEYRIANDASGSEATSWTSTPGIVDAGQFIQLRTTSSEDGSSTVDVEVTIGAEVFEWSVTTESTAAFTAADNGGTAYSRVASTISPDTGLRRVAIALRFRPNTVDTGQNIIADASASYFRVWFPSPNTFRALFVASNVCQLRATLEPGSAAKTHLITLDFTNGNAGQGCYWATVEDGMILNNSAGTFGVFDTRSTPGSGSDYGSRLFPAAGAVSLFGSGHLGVFAEGDGGGSFADGAIEFIWIDWGDETYVLPDITNAGVRALWNADVIGANGEGPTGSAPKLYYTGDLTAWNSGGGIPNLGTISNKPLVKQAGTYT